MSEQALVKQFQKDCDDIEGEDSTIVEESEADVEAHLKGEEDALASEAVVKSEIEAANSNALAEEDAMSTKSEAD